MSKSIFLMKMNVRKSNKKPLQIMERAPLFFSKKFQSCQIM